LNAALKDLRENKVRWKAWWSRSVVNVSLWRSNAFGTAWKIFGQDEPGSDDVTLGSKVTQQPTEGEQIDAPRGIRQGWILLTQRPNPSEQMRVTAQLRHVD
jgi:hypothetical protein